MFKVVCWKWTQPGYRSKFSAEHVNILASMVKRNLKMEYKFCCITDDAAGIDSSVEIIPLWDDYATVPNPSFDKGPSCYRRLKAFSAEAEQLIGPRFVSLDLDTVIVRDVTPIWNRPNDEFIIWGDTEGHRGRFIPRIPGHMRVMQRLYNGSMWLLKAGSRRQVWDKFNPETSPQEAHSHGRHGSDQGWISHCLGPGQTTWHMNDGVFSYRNHIARFKKTELPEGARIVMFHGRVDPDSEEAQKLLWVRENYK